MMRRRREVGPVYRSSGDGSMCGLVPCAVVVGSAHVGAVSEGEWVEGGKSGVRASGVVDTLCSLCVWAMGFREM